MKQFEQDIEHIFTRLSAFQEEDRQVFEAIEQGEVVRCEALDRVMEASGLAPQQSVRLAAAKRLFMLREEGVLSLLKNKGCEAGTIEARRDGMRQAVAAFYEARFAGLLEAIAREELLSPFYCRVLAGVHRIGVAFNRLHPRWLHAITRSHTYLEQIAGGPRAVPAYLKDAALIDPDRDGQPAERCYSVIGGDGVIRAYAEAFEPEVAAIIKELERLMADLAALEDRVYDEKAAWMSYLQALMAALGERDRKRLFGRWVAVDEAWMAITGPIQPGHPMEYYEDRYRYAVAPEWDVRLHNPRGAIGACKETIWPMAEATFEQVAPPAGEAAMRQAKSSLDRTRLYGARPLLYYGALMDGLFSAQVVPNDEVVSAKHGKKIFAFGEYVLSSARMKPAMALEEEIYEPDFLSRYRAILFGESVRWLEIYDIETVGHELGHLLWVDTTTESVMNQSGAFKLIEEFKATTGGLMGFFSSDRVCESALLEAVIVTHTRRAVELMAWRESSEVAAYYHEGLIHLSGLFASGLCRFEEGRLQVSLQPERIEALIAWYRQTWLLLTECYLLKQDARTFLDRFVDPERWPIQEAARVFAEHYWTRYQAIGQRVKEKEVDAS